MKTTILAFGKLRGSEADLSAEYLKRLGGDVTLKILASPPASLPPAEMQRAEGDAILKHIPDGAFVVVLDERGKDVSSREFAAKMKTWVERAPREMVFVIGGSHGVTDNVRTRADYLWAFGRATWPHRLVRVMLLEQLYRAQQINIGHPYHRD